MHGYLFHARRNSFISLFYWYNEGNESILFAWNQCPYRETSYFLWDTTPLKPPRVIYIDNTRFSGGNVLSKNVHFTSPFIEDLRMAFSCIFFIVGLLLSFWHIPHFHSLPIFNNEVENFQGDFGSLLSIACCSIIMEGDTPFWTWDLVCF